MSFAQKKNLENFSFFFKKTNLRITLFKKYNSGLPSSAAVERLFSTAGDVLRPKRACLSEANFENLVFLKGNLHLFKQTLKLQEDD